MNITCFGFLVFFSCEMPKTPPPANTYCQIARPIYWSLSDSRETKMAVDRHNAAWKRVCRK